MASTLPKPLEQTGGPFKFILEQFEDMSERGIFGDYRVELLNGEIFVMPRKGPRHAAQIRKLSKKFEQIFGEKFWVSVQLPVILLALPPDYVEPDVALLEYREDAYAARDVTSELSRSAILRWSATKGRSLRPTPETVSPKSGCMT
ncbi:MAG: hypothetical protein C4332_03665 [Meiothermus sp.]